MKTETFKVTVRHDHGTIRIQVVSLSGIQGAVTQVTTAERCPECAIIGIKRIEKR